MIWSARRYKNAFQCSPTRVYSDRSLILFIEAYFQESACRESVVRQPNPNLHQHIQARITQTQLLLGDFLYPHQLNSWYKPGKPGVVWVGWGGGGGGGRENGRCLFNWSYPLLDPICPIPPTSRKTAFPPPKCPPATLSMFLCLLIQPFLCWLQCSWMQCWQASHCCQLMSSHKCPLRYDCDALTWHRDRLNRQLELRYYSGSQTVVLDLPVGHKSILGALWST